MTTTPTDLRGLARAAAADPASTPRIAAPPSRWKTRLLLPAVIIAIVIGLLLVTSAQTLLPASPVRVVPAMVKSVGGSSGAVTVQAPGWLEPDPYPNYVAALAEGVVADVLVLEGDPVAAGQVVARLIDDDAQLELQRAEAELRRQQAERAAASARLDAARELLETLVDRTRAVAAAVSLVAEIEAGIKKVDADVVAARAELAGLQDEYDRKAPLVESRAVSEAVVARLRLRVDAQQAAVEATEAQIGVLEARLQQAEADARAAARHRELLIEERQALAIAEAAALNAEASVALAQAARDEAALRLERMTVRSPVAGIVLRRLVSPGSKLSLQGDEHAAHVVHVYDPRHLQVRVDVPLADAAHVSVGQPADVTIEVLPDRTFSGTVTRVVHQADIQKNTVEVKVALDDPDAALKPEMLARVRFMALSSEAAGTLRQRVFVPAELVRADESGGSAVLLVGARVDDRGRVERRSVVAGSRRVDGWIEIESGLQPGDQLVADPSADLEAGDRVRIVGERTDIGG